MSPRLLGSDQIIDAEIDENTFEDDNDAILDDVLSQLGDEERAEIRVKIKKVDPITKKQENCFYCHPDELANITERLRDEYGPGVYHAYVQRGRKMLRNIQYRVAARLHNAPAPVQRSQISEFSEAMREHTQQMAQLMAGQVRPAAVADPFQQFTQMMGALGQVKELFGGSTRRESSFDDFVKMFDIVQNMQGGDTAGRNTIDLIAEAIRSPGFEKMMEGLGRASTQTRALPAPARSPDALTIEVEQAAPVAPAAAETPLAEQFGFPVAPAEPSAAAVAAVDNPLGMYGIDDETFITIRDQLQEWVKRAKKGTNTELMAELALDDWASEDLLTLFGLPNLRQIGSAIVPDVDVCWPWFEDLKADIIRLTSEEDQEDNGGGEMSADARPATGAAQSHVSAGHDQPAPGKGSSADPHADLGGAGGGF